MSFVDFIGFIITFGALIVLFARKAREERRRREDPEGYAREQKRKQEELEKFYKDVLEERSKTKRPTIEDEEQEDEIVVLKVPPPPPAPVIHRLNSILIMDKKSPKRLQVPPIAPPLLTKPAIPKVKKRTYKIPKKEMIIYATIYGIPKSMKK